MPSGRKSGEEKTGWAKAPKRPKLMESFFVSEPLKAKGDSEDDVNVVDSEQPPLSSVSSHRCSDRGCSHRRKARARAGIQCDGGGEQ